MMKRVHVAAAVIYGQDGRILLAKRPDHVHQGGLWEFPGGKLRDGESVQAALSRELEEELGIQVIAGEPLVQISHDYPDKLVLLDFWKVTQFTGEPSGAEGQPVKWVAVEDLPSYSYPEANKPVLELLGARC